MSSVRIRERVAARILTYDIRTDKCRRGWTSVSVSWLTVPARGRLRTWVVATDLSVQFQELFVRVRGRTLPPLQ